MLNRTPIFQAHDPRMLGSGLMPDQHLLNKMLWDEAESVVFVNGRVRRRLPAELMLNFDADPIRGLSQHVDTNGVRWVWAASGGKVYRWYGPPKELIFTEAAWQEDEGLLYRATFWDLVPYGDWMLINSSLDELQVYKPGLGLQVLGDAPQNVVTIRKFLAFIMAIGYGASKTRVGWSNGDIITEWTAGTENNLAGSLTIAEFNTPIRAAAQLGDSLALYSEDQMAVMTYIGYPNQFGYKFRLDGIGAVGKAAVATDGKNNVGVGRNGVWWTDSLSFRYIDEGALHDYLQDNVNWDQASKVVATRNDVTGCFEFCFPMGDSVVPSEAWAFDPRTGGWSQVPSFSLKDERKLFHRPLVGDLEGNVYRDSNQRTGDPLVLKTKPLLPQLQIKLGELADVHMACNVQEVDFMLKAASNVEWRIGSSQEPVGPWTFTDWRAAHVGAPTYPVQRKLPTAPYHVLEFRSTADDWDIDLQGFTLFGQVEGVKRRVTT